MLKLIQEVSAYRRLVLFRCGIQRKAAAVTVNPPHQGRIHVLGVSQVIVRCVGEVGREIVAENPRRRIVPVDAQGYEWESSRGVVMVILLAVVREPEANRMCSFLPGLTIRSIEQRIIGADG